MGYDTFLSNFFHTKFKWLTELGIYMALSVDGWKSILLKNPEILTHDKSIRNCNE